MEIAYNVSLYKKGVIGSITMKRAQESRSEPENGGKEKTKAKSKSKGAKSKAKATTPVSTDGASDETKKGDKSNFEGDYFKDFYYNQGDYKECEREEEEEMKHAKEITSTKKWLYKVFSGYSWNKTPN